MSDTTLPGLIAELRQAAKRTKPHEQVLMRRAAAVIEDLARRLQPARNTTGEIEFVIESGVSAKTGQPMVQVAVGGTLTQIAPAIARKLAIDLLDSASGAEDDAALLVVGREMQLDDEMIGRLIASVRRARDTAKSGERVRSA